MTHHENEPCPVTHLPCNTCHIACHIQMRVAEGALNALSAAEKHAKALYETGAQAIFLPATLYAMAEKAGVDMTRYVIQHMLPTSEEMREAIKVRCDAGLPLGAQHVRPVEATAKMREHIKAHLAAYPLED
jgi:aspartate/glutamate racemase